MGGLREVAGGGGEEADRLGYLQHGAVDVRLRFSQSLLEDWERTKAAAISFVTGLLRKQD